MNDLVDRIRKECHLCSSKTELEHCIVCGYYFCKAHHRLHVTPGYWGVGPLLVAKA